jgi:chromosomal replication initiation ATPase DnaA
MSELPDDIKIKVEARVLAFTRSLKKLTNRTVLLNYVIGDALDAAEKVQIKLFLTTVCTTLEITQEQLNSGYRTTRLISDARCILIKLLRTHTSLSLANIGKLVGGVDHSTVNYHLTRFDDRLSAKDIDFIDQYNEVMKALNLQTTSKPEACC